MVVRAILDWELANINKRLFYEAQIPVPAKHLDSASVSTASPHANFSACCKKFLFHFPSPASHSETPSSQEASAAAINAGARRTHPIILSSYSLWRFTNAQFRDFHTCIDMADRFGFDGVELLLYQLDQNELLSRSKLMAYKRHSLRLGLPLVGLSTHQGFVTPNRQERQENVARTIGQIEIAYQLGIPVMRVNTGRWGTSGSFDILMANRGIEPPLEGYTDDDAYPWVIESLEKCLPTAEKCGVVLGLENHWGLGLTPEGILRIVNAIIPWLKL